MTRAALLQTIIDNISQSKRSAQAHFVQNYEKLGLSPAQLEVLRTLQCHQPMTPKDLAAKLQLTPGAISQLLDALEQADCIVRTHSETDRRISYISVSRGGKRKLDTAYKFRMQVMTDALQTLTDEDLQTYLTVQQKLLDWLEANPPTPSKRSSK